jgi:hypothetical protein
MPARRLLALPVLAVALAGCGGASADLFAIDRTGDGPGARFRVVVNDGGTLSCDSGKSREMPPEMLLEARDVQRELAVPAEEGLVLGPEPGSVLQYDVQTPDGRVQFADNSRGRPPVLDRVVVLVRQAATEVCGLSR